MYFPIGWPKVLKLPEIWTTNIIQVVCNLDKILFAVLTEDSVGIWFCKPCVPIVFHHRSIESLSKLGTNILAEWKPDSSMIVIATSEGHLLFLNVHVAADTRSLYVQTDSPQASLRRDSAELFVKETIPPLHLSVAHEVMVWDGSITSIVCITMTEIMVSTTKGHILRYRWDGTQNRDYCLDLRRIPFCINKQVSKAEPISEDNTYVNDMEYSPLVGGFAVTFNNGKAAFVTASSLRFDPNQVQGIWAQGIEDATCASVNHKFRLIVFGRKNSQCVVYTVDETTGGLELSHECALSGKDYPGSPGEVTAQCWTPDGCTMAVTWARGGLALWSTFGALLVCSLGWDYGLNVDLTTANPLQLISMDWASEGYQLWMIRKETEETNRQLIELDFVKSAITVNPCMTQQPHLYLQGDDRLYVNLGDALTGSGPGRRTGNANDVLSEQGSSNGHGGESRQWLVISIPETYSATNWPIKYTALDVEGQHLAIAGRTGLAHYSLQTRKWRLFGNESQERDFIVTGGLLWWRDYAIMGAYSVLDNADQLRFYPRECKLDNRFAKIVSMPAQVLLINIMQDQLITFCSDAQISVYKIEQIDAAGRLDLTKLQAVDVSALCVHSACVVSVALSTLRAEQGGTSSVRSIVLNVSGRLLMVPCEQVVHSPSNGLLFTCGQATVLASGVEMVWAPGNRTGGSGGHKLHLTEALWLACGASGMRVWLPLFPKRTAPQPQHAFISKRIMLPFQLNIYPLAILFENAIILGAENDTVLYSSDTNSPFSLPFCVLEKTSQVYLHQILRQLIRRNLGYHAWEIARSCTNLPYFPHSLELLLHEVLEEEATSKEPIPDAQMPSVVEFISEFPVYLQTVVQCARKTEIALWPCLFSAAGKPKHLFQQCLDIGQLETAASYLIILQNLEPSSVSRQHATLLLDTALEQGRWSLARDLVRFLRAIGPSDGDLPPKSPLQLTQQTQSPVSPNAEDLSLVPGVGRGRSYSTTVPPKDLKQEKGEHGKDFRESRRDSKVEHRKHSKSECQKSVENHMEVKRKKSAPVSINKSDSGDTPSTAEHFYIDLLVQRHARRLLSSRRLPELGRLAAHLDFHLVTWLGRERDRAARVDDAVAALKKLHEDFTWPYPMSVMGQSQEQVEIDQEEHEARKLGCTEDQLKLLRIDTSSSRVGDSGYTSLPRGSAVTVLASGPCDEAVTAASVASAVWPDEVDSLTWPPGPLPPPIGILEHSVAERGSPKSEVQLRYLLQLFMEASCLEWALIVSVLLRDAMAVLRIVNAARAPELTADTVKRLTDALHCLLYWTHHECFGYKPFMSTIQSQSPVLLRILCSKQLIQQQSISIEESDRPASTTPVGRSRTASTSSASASEVTATAVGVVSTVSAFTGSTPHSPRSDDTYQCVVS